MIALLSDAELTILGLVAESARYGSEIEQAIDERRLRDWLAIGTASVYYVLRQLERRGLASSQPAPDGSRERAAYRITEAGQGVLQTAVADLLRQPRLSNAGFELGLANLGVLKPEQVLTAVSQYADALRQRLEVTEARQQQDESLSDAHKAWFSHSLALMRAELDWLSAFLDDWRSRYPPPGESAAAEDDAQGEPTPFSKQTIPKAAKRLQSVKPRRTAE